uniref:Uncharacterized protein n=1 Tax=Siphoviridae sp. ctzlI32 TaxID=2827981 RepID=A0A8S5SYG5_9CAUD|nr:MAG TPA: hypothetical protein [Siphoviridae sp. ctzlI32]
MWGVYLLPFGLIGCIYVKSSGVGALGLFTYYLFLILVCNVKDPTFLQGLNEYGFQLTENIVFYTAGKRLCFRIHCTLIIFDCQENNTTYL